MQFKQRVLVPILLIMVGLAIYSIHNLFWTGGAVAWHGALLASVALPGYMALFLAKGGAARTSPRLIPVQVLAAVGVTLSTGNVGAFVVALLSFAGLEWYIFLYSRYGRTKTGAIKIGQPLPTLTFEDLDGAPVGTADFVGSQMLLVFFRGNWCPLCMAQLRELTARADRLKAAGVEIRFISNQSVEKSKELATKLGLGRPFQILRDVNLGAAKQLNIADIGGTPAGVKGFPGDTVMATVIALDHKGRVIFGDETDNYRVRPHPDSFLPVFETPPDKTPGVQSNETPVASIACG